MDEKPQSVASRRSVSVLYFGCSSDAFARGQHMFSIPHGHTIRLPSPRLHNRRQVDIPVVINAIAARQLGFASPELALGQALRFRSVEKGVAMLITKRIVGIAPEIRFYSLREAPGAIAYELWEAGTTLTVRASGSIADAERAARAVWPRYYPNSVL